MREIKAEIITEKIKEMFIQTSYFLPQDVKEAVMSARDREEDMLARDTLSCLLENYRIAGEGVFPICQDTGIAVIFLEIGQEVVLTGGYINDAVNEGVKQAYEEAYLRKSVVGDPLFVRKNTGTNTPAIIHTEIVPGKTLKITVAPKGGGSENMSAIAMLKPADGVEKVKEFVLETVRKAGSNPCPPVIVGIGIGGNFEYSALLSKKALLRDLSDHHPEKQWSDLENDLLLEINNLGIGPQGFGGNTTALAVKIEHTACHFASLPVAVNLQCHAARHATVEI